jgi:hypothetical protein
MSSPGGNGAFLDLLRAASQGDSSGATPERPERTAEDVCTIDDLARAGSQVSWIWRWWIPSGVCVAVASEAGLGKTRFCADLIRRVRHRLPWPDGQAMTLAADALSLWVLADNHHDEMVDLCRDFQIGELVRINAWKDNPYGGVTLETADDLNDLDARMRLLKPAMVIVDTVGNATDRNLGRQEDAKAFYFPLQVLARRHRCAVICLTHLNADGKFLGRRVLEKVRVALRMERPDPGEERRRIEVHKSNSKKPAALGVTMGDVGNDYDHEPPEAPADEPGTGASGPSKTGKAVAWLRDYLSRGPKRVSITRDDAESEDISSALLYRAKATLEVEEVKMEGYKWWQLPNTGENQ